MVSNKKITPEETIRKIIENYNNLEKALVNQIQLETPNHHPTTGSYRELIWKDLFEQIIPRKFCIAQSVFIIDSNGNISSEVDLAIFDEQYTPYIFNYGKIKFIPIEAVVVVIQCKSRNPDVKDLTTWVDSIAKLRTSLDSFTRVMTGLKENSTQQENNNASQTSTRPIRILCTTSINNWNNDKDLFDIFISIDEDNNLQKYIPKEDQSFLDWYEQLNHYDSPTYDRKNSRHPESSILRNLKELRVEVKTGVENVIVSLTFQLNQLLMLINNPMPFPHRAYVELFNQVLSKQPHNNGGAV